MMFHCFWNCDVVYAEFVTWALRWATQHPPHVHWKRRYRPPTRNKKEDEEAQSKMATAPKRSTPVRISPAKATPVKGRFEDCDDDWVLKKIKPVTLQPDNVIRWICFRTSGSNGSGLELDFSRFLFFLLLCIAGTTKQLVVVVVLPDPFRGMGARRNSAETQLSGYTPRSGP